MTDWLKTLLFSLEPETAHQFAKKLSCVLPHSVLRRQNQIQSPVLKMHWQNLSFSNPIGLAAGFDKEASALQLIETLGFGFVELGSVSYAPCDGNTKPRIFRLLEDEALINWMGLPNPGIEKFLENLHKQHSQLPRGISLVKTPDMAFAAQKRAVKNGIDDFVDSFTLAHNQADYICLNLSCPNSGEAKLFEDPNQFAALAREISLARTSLTSETPLFIKISPMLAPADLQKTVELALKYNFDGFVVSNTLTSRPELKTTLSAEQKKRGGLSGKPVLTAANAQLKRVYEIVGREKCIMGVGGIHDLESLLSKLQNGASCFQVYTGLIYGGFSFVRDLNRGLVAYCEKRGVKHYSELIGQKIDRDFI